MESAIERPTIGDIRNHLLSGLDFAEGYAHHQPEHASDVTRLLEEVRRLKSELMSSFENEVQVSLHNVVLGIGTARMMAEFMAERDPEKCGPLMQFAESLKHAYAEFIGKVIPQAGNCP